MNICLISTAYPPEDGGGIGTYSANLALGLANRGHNVIVVAKTKGEDKEEFVQNVCVLRYGPRYIPKVEYFLPGFAWSWFLARQIQQLDKKYHFDIIEFPNWEGGGLCYLLKKKRRPVVIRLHTPYFETLAIDAGNQVKLSLADRFICWMEKVACQKSDRLVSSTECHKQLMARHYHIPEEKVHIIPLGIEITHDTTYAVSNGKKKILYVSRLENRKGTLSFLEAIPRILEECPDTEFYLIGKDRPHAPEGIFFRDYFLNHYPQLSGLVHFLGFVSNEDLEKYYATCDLFIVPSVYESFGLIYIEAMKYGKAVVACRAGGVPEVVAENETGLLVEPNNPAQVASAAIQLLKDDKRRYEMGQNAIRRCQNLFSREEMARKTESFYKSVIQQHGRNEKF